MGRECPRILERLAAYVDELLAPDERDEVERHLGRCPPCQHCASDEKAARLLLRARAFCLRSTALPPALRARCEALLKGQKPPGDLT